MYQFSANSIGYEGQTILEGLTMEARLHDGRNLTLHHQGEAASISRHGKQGTRFSFVDDEGAVEAFLDFVDEGRRTAVYVQATARNKELFRDRVSFAAYKAIRIQVEALPDLQVLMATYQHKDWWTRPHFNKQLNELPERTLSLLWKTTKQYLQLLPVTGKVYRSEIVGQPSGFCVQLSSYQGGFDRCETLAFVLGAGENPYTLIEDNVEFAFKSTDLLARPRKEKTYPEILDYLGWCSWDAFYQEVDAQGLLTKTEELAEAGLPVRWVMIDDGWSEVKGKRLHSYDAVKSKFPGGLAPVIQQMKEQHGVRWVGVWHTIAGYWGGVDPEGELFPSNQSHLYKTNGDVWVPAPDAAAGFGFWNDWHGYLKKQGVDFVKVDSQSAVANFFDGLQPIGGAAEAAHTALEASIGLHFGGTVINCMGMAAENIWHRPASSVSRNSDDFVPEVEDGFKEHALQNAYNSYFHGPFYWGDWDMYWTKNQDDQQNMVLRAVSGGPIYFSDKVGATVAEHVWPLIYQDGKIIRCDLPGQPTEDCLFVNPMETAVPLKLWNRVGDAGILAAFNILRGEGSVEGGISPTDVPGLQGDRFWVVNPSSGEAYTMLASERRSIHLGPMGAELYVVVPERSGGVTPIGLVNKLVSPAAIQQVTDYGGQTWIRLREGGRLAFAARKRPSAVSVQGAELTMEEQGSLYIVDCSHLQGELVVEIRV